MLPAKRPSKKAMNSTKYARAPHLPGPKLTSFLSIQINKFDRAIRKYKKAADFVESDYSMEENEKPQAKALKVACLSNVAASYIKLKNWKEVINNSNKVLELDATNIKALFRRGQGMYTLFRIANYRL